MDFTSIKERLGAIYKLLQELQMPSTKHNMEIVLGSMNTLDQIFTELTELENKTEKTEGE